MSRKRMRRVVVGMALVAGAVTAFGSAPASAALPEGVTLLADFATGDSSRAYGLTEMGGKVYTSASDGTHENSLFVTDGVGGNSLVIDTNPSGNNKVYSVVSNGSKLFFGADDGTHGSEWWVSDGTAAGSAMLKDADPGSSGGSPYGSFVLGTTAYTWMWPTGASGWQLWKSDGTSAGTSMVVETPLWDVNWMGNAGGKAYFVAAGGDTDGAYEVWVTDGTSGGTHLVKNLFDGWSSSDDFGSFAPIGNSMAFGIIKYGSGNNGLWITDGTDAGTTQIYATSGNEMMRDVTVLGGSLYATTEGNAYYGCVSSAGALLKSDGTLAGTTKVIGYTCSDYGHRGFRDIGVLGTGLVLTGYDDTEGWQLWKSDGTAAGTLPVDNVVWDNASSPPSNFVSLSATQTIFYAGNGDPGVWITDGTAVGTKLLTPYGKKSLEQENRVVVGSKLFFVADDLVHGIEVWVTDGTSEGTEMTYDVNQTGDSAFGQAVPFGDGALLNARLTGYGAELVYTDGTGAGTRLVKDIQPGVNDGVPNGFTAVGDKMVFSAYTTELDFRLWITDGTDAGTTLVKDPSGTGGPRVGYLQSVSLGATAIFAADDGTNGLELWVTDGTDAGTTLVKDINPGASASSPANFVVMGTKAYFFADNGTNGPELWVTDGTDAGTSLVKDINPGSNGSLSYYAKFKVAGSTLFFAADDGTNGLELWKSDGTGAGTALVKDIQTGSGSAFNTYQPPKMQSVGSTVFFAADDGTNGVELWKSDGTDAGTSLVKNIRAGSDSSIDIYNAHMAVVGSTVFFTADDGTSGRELWRSDGTGAGTSLVKDISPGSNRSDPWQLTAFDSSLYFAANDGTDGAELWVSDGTSAGTSSPFDLTPASGQSTDPRNLVAVGSLLTFNGRSAQYGLELYAYNPLPRQTISFSPSTNMKAHDKVALSATATSSLTVTFTASGDCEIKASGKDAGKLHLKREGKCTVTASQAGNAEWAPADDVVVEITIGKNSVTVAFVGTVRAPLRPVSPFVYGSGYVRLKAQLTPALEGCQVQFSVSPNTATPSGPYTGTSDEDGVVLSDPISIAEGTYDFTVTPLGDCEGAAADAPDVFLGELPATGVDPTVFVWAAVMFLVAGALLVSRQRRRA